MLGVLMDTTLTRKAAARRRAPVEAGENDGLQAGATPPPARA
jgi:hypothetical protein